MNATKFVVLLVIGVLCANVSARDESKETKLGTSVSKTSTKGIGAELSVNGETNSYSAVYTAASATKGPKGPRADTYESGSTYTNGRISAKGRKADASSTSRSSANGNSEAEANRKGAAARSNGFAGSDSTVKGRTSDKKKGKKGKKN